MKRLLVMLLLTNLAIVTACSDKPVETAHIGYVEAEYVYIAAPQAGWLETLNAHEGDVIAKGDLLFALDTDQQALKVAEAENRVRQAGAQVEDLSTGARPAEIALLQAQLNEARTRYEFAIDELNRAAPLIESGTLAKARGDQLRADRDTAKARLDAATESIRVAKQAGRKAAREGASAAQLSALAALEEARWALAQRSVHSLSEGRIEDVFQREGEFISAGRPVLSILPDNALKVRFFVAESDLVHTEIGQIVRVHADGLDADVEARISFIASEAEFTPPVIYSVGSREKLVFLVEARLPAGTSLHAGLPVEVDME